MLTVLSLGRIAGIRVAIHPSWLVLFALVTYSVGTVLREQGTKFAFFAAGGFALLLFASIIAHEFAHALTARHFGVRTRAITLFLFGGVATLEREPPTPRSEVLIALAGPLISVVLAAGWFAFTLGLERPDLAPLAWVRFLQPIALYLTVSNIAIAVFNLIPAYPMDGGRVLRALLWRLRRNHASATAIASLTGVGFSAILGIGGLVMLATTREWQFGWYVVVSLFLARTSWVGYAQARELERFERSCAAAGLKAQRSIA